MTADGAEKRRESILQHLSQCEFADIAQLSQKLNVSEMTIRRDLVRLQEEKRLLRVHGGAVPMPQATYEAPFDKRFKVNQDEKGRIGRYAASLVREGDVIALDASSTALMMVEHLKDKNITVVTNNLYAAVRLVNLPNVEIIQLGGAVRKPSASCVGLETVHMMRSYHVDKLFMSSKAISLANGVTDATTSEGEAKKAMIEASASVYLMMDHSKLETVAFYNVCAVSRINHLIVNGYEEYTAPQRRLLEKCGETGITIHYA